jgi:hypothetical protein
MHTRGKGKMKEGLPPPPPLQAAKHPLQADSDKHPTAAARKQAPRKQAAAAAAAAAELGATVNEQTTPFKRPAGAPPASNVPGDGAPNAKKKKLSAAEATAKDLQNEHQKLVKAAVNEPILLTVLGVKKKGGGATALSAARAAQAAA